MPPYDPIPLCAVAAAGKPVPAMRNTNFLILAENFSFNRQSCIKKPTKLQLTLKVHYT